MDRSLNCFLRIYSVSVLAQRVATPSLPKNSGKSRCRGCPTTCKTLPSDFGYINAKDLHEHSVSNPYPKYKPTHKKKGSRKNIRALLCVPQATGGGCQPAKPPPYCRHPGALRGVRGACPSVLWRFSFLNMPFRGLCRSQPRREARHTARRRAFPRARAAYAGGAAILSRFYRRGAPSVCAIPFFWAAAAFFCQRHPFQENDLCRSAPTSRKS